MDGETIFSLCLLAITGGLGVAAWRIIRKGVVVYVPPDPADPTSPLDPVNTVSPLNPMNPGSPLNPHNTP